MSLPLLRRKRSRRVPPPDSSAGKTSAAYRDPRQDPLYNPEPQALERPRRRRRRRSWPVRLFRGAVAIVVLWLMLTILLVWPWGYLPLPTTSFMLQSAWQNRRPYSYRWTAYRKIAPEMALAVITAEDQRFPTHNGFDFEEIGAALRDYQQGGSLRGASTISQQVAKNLYLWPGRSAIRKGMEVWFTWWIELLWSKERILTVYLNVAQMGDRTFGVGAASRQFFGVKPQELTEEEAALLAVSLPNPELYRVTEPSDQMYVKQDWILRQMYQLGGIEYLEKLYEAPTLEEDE